MQRLIEAGLVVRFIQAAPDERIPEHLRPNLYVVKANPPTPGVSPPPTRNVRRPPRET